MSRARPRLVLAHWDGIGCFTEADLDRLDEVGELLDRSPLVSWDDPRADDLLGRAEVIVGHWGCPPFTPEVLDRAPHLAMFAYAAGTVKAQVIDEMFDRGVLVTSGAAANAEPVAEYTLAAILFAGKDVFFARDRLRDPALADVDRRGPAPLGNWGRTVGIVAASLVGRRVIELLAAFPHLPTLVYDPYLTPAEAAALGTEKVDDLVELCRRSHVLSIHAPALPETADLVGAEHLAALPDGATVINTARGWVLDQDALTAEVRAGRLSAVLDVLDEEPVPPDHPLLALPDVVVTPHLAGSQGAELGRLVDHVVEEVRRFAAGEPPRHPVTRDRLARLA